MLYLSTRNKNDTQTAYKTIHQNRCSDGGQFVPFHLLTFTKEQLAAFQGKSFGQNVADVLNLCFSAGLTGWDIDFMVGRNSTKLGVMNHRILMCEMWHNAGWDFDYMTQELSKKLRREDHDAPATQWVRIAVRIAAIFGIYGLLLSERAIEPDDLIDIALPTGDFTTPMAVYYARHMGLPVNNIVCGCNENGALWDLVNLGELPTGNTLRHTDTPLCDHVVPAAVECLIYERLSQEEARSFADAFARGRTYYPPEEQASTLCDGFFTAVISSSRVASVIHNVYRNTDQIIGPYDALAYASLLDYRAKTGQGRTALLLSERSPVCDCAVTATALQISEADLNKRLKGC